MEEKYDRLWQVLEGTRGWQAAKDDIKGLVKDPMLWATNLIEYAVNNHADRPGVTHVNDAAWDKVAVALDVLKWLNEE